MDRQLSAISRQKKLALLASRLSLLATSFGTVIPTDGFSPSGGICGSKTPSCEERIRLPNHSASD
jgi:hypothetical protein